MDGEEEMGSKFSLMLKWSAMVGESLTEAAKRKPATASQLNK